MKKFFVTALFLCASALAGTSLANNKNSVANADGGHKLLFAAHDFSSNADMAGYNNGESSLKSPNYQNGITTLSFTKSQTYSIYYESFVGTSYMAMTAGKTYRYSLTYKTTDALQVHLWCNGWTLIDDYAFSQDWTTVTYDITAGLSSSFNYAFQAPDGLTGDLLIKNVYFGELRSYSTGETIGTLPSIPQIEGYSSTWTIDGQEINADTILNYSEDKIVLAKYESTASSYKVCFVEHDLVEDYSPRPLDSVDCMARKLENNQLVLTGQTGAYYFSKAYTFEAGKTYYVSGAYKNDEFSSFSLYLEAPWTDIFVGRDSWSGYTDFYFEFSVPTTGVSRFGVQCAWSGEGSIAGQRDVSQYMRNFLCGEVRTYTKNAEMGDLPTLPSKTGFTCEGWTINGQAVNESSIYNFGQDAYAYPSFVESGYKIGFAEVDYGDQPQQTNCDDLQYSLENGVLHMVSTKREGPALWINPIDVIQGHDYIVSLTFKKDHNDTSVLFREDNIDETLVACTSTEYQTIVYEITAQKSYFHFYFQFTWWTEGASSASADVESFYIADLNNGMTILNGDTYGVLPIPSDETITHYSWAIDGNTIFEDGTFAYEENKIAILVSAVSFDVEFVINGEVVETKAYYTGDVVGEFPEYTPISGYEYRWVIGDEQIAVNEYSVLNYETKQTITLVKTATTYYATFIADGVEVSKVGFTVESTSIEEPLVPFKEGYTGAWEEYTLGTENIIINSVYTPVTHYVTFMVDGVEVAKVGYIPGDEQIEEPVVPNKEGYVGVWEDYELTGENITVNAVYTGKQYLLYFRVSADSEPIYLVRVTFGEKIGNALEALPNIPEVEGKIGKWVIGDNEITLDTVWNVSCDSQAIVLYEDDPNYKPASRGCGGSIVTGSALICVGVISLLTILGVKKKYE